MLKRFTYFFFFIILLFPFKGIAQSQPKQVKINHANRLEYDERLGKNVNRLIGNVQLEHEGMVMNCDSAYFYSESNQVDAFGNVHIIKSGGTDIYSQYLKYNGNTRMAEFQKSVRLIDNGSTLSTDLLYYDMKNSVANYPNGGTIVSKDNTLTSDHGYYNPSSKTFSFKKNVVLVNPQYTIRCDTMIYNSATKTCFFIGPTHIKNKTSLIYCEYGWYNSESNTSLFKKNAYILTEKQRLKGDSVGYDQVKGIGKAFGHVEINDTSQNIIVTGDLATFFEKEKKSLITGHTLLKQYDDEDTLFLNADTIYSMDIPLTKKRFKEDTATTQKLLLAYHHVQFFREDLQGKCDSLAYTEADSLMRLFRSPVLWSDKSQITADNIDLLITSGSIKKMFMRHNAFIISKKDSTKFDQIKGKDMTGFFKNNELVKIHVVGNGQTIYFPKDKDKYVGVNKADCNNLVIYITENEVKKITFLKKPEATLFPMSDFNQKDFTLKDFIWRENERPLSVQDILR